MEFFASCPEGFERPLADELRALGIRRVRPLKGRVSFEGEAVDAERVCLWSRLASRVLAVIARFPCRDADDLYDGVYRVPWERVLRRGSTVAVSARGTNDELRNTRYIALRAKDALCDRLADETGLRADVDTERPDARIAVALRGDRATLQLDLTGEPLFHRGPRLRAERPLRPDYAALLLACAGWAGACAADGAAQAAPLLVDAACAGGSVTAEAAGTALDRAPGRGRRRWGFTCWSEHDERSWTHLLAEADRRAAEADGRAGARGIIVATDADPRAVEALRAALKGTGLEWAVEALGPEDALGRLEGGDAPDGARAAAGAVVADLSELPLHGADAACSLLAEIRRTSAAEGLPAVVLARDGGVERALGRAGDVGARVRPGNAPARILSFPPGADAAASVAEPRAYVDVDGGAPVGVLVPASDQFAARLRKVARLRRKWARRAGVTCYRVYDADLPDYAAAIDLYEGAPDTPGRWLVVSEYAAPRSVDPALAAARMHDILAIAPRVLDVEPDRVAARSRTRARGGSQYAASGRAPHARQGAHGPLVLEGGLTFEVNFDDYLDTGIFLDHRVTRSLVRDRARGARFLNLFAYTGTATCYAADGGAVETTTVDMSNTYLEWARRNMARNGFTGQEHRFVRDDVLAWVDRQSRSQTGWDLIFCDPPTFSSSSKMGERTWDVQRDHAGLIARLLRMLAPGGEIVFSCNLRTFEPDLSELARAGAEVEDISAQTIPEDFARNPRIHRCYIVRRAR